MHGDRGPSCYDDQGASPSPPIPGRDWPGGKPPFSIRTPLKHITNYQSYINSERWVIFCLPVSGKIARVTVPFATQPMTPWNSGAHRGVMAVDTAKYSTYCHWMSWRHFHFCKDEKRHQTNLTSLNITRHSTVLGCMVQVKSCPNLSNEVSLIMAPRLAPDYFRCPKKSQPDTIFFCKQCGYTWVLFVLKEIQPFAFAQLGLFFESSMLGELLGSMTVKFLRIFANTFACCPGSMRLSSN